MQYLPEIWNIGWNVVLGTRIEVDLGSQNRRLNSLVLLPEKTGQSVEGNIHLELEWPTF